MNLTIWREVDQFCDSEQNSIFKIKHKENNSIKKHKKKIYSKSVEKQNNAHLITSHVKRVRNNF